MALLYWSASRYFSTLVPPNSSLVDSFLLLESSLRGFYGLLRTLAIFPSLLSLLHRPPDIHILFLSLPMPAGSGAQLRGE